MEDRFDYIQPGLSAPASRAIAIAPDDTAELAFVPRAIYVGGAGDITMRGENGVTAVWKNVPAGTVLPFRPSHVSATGTTATYLLALD